jgi:hypothetical protein
LPDRRYTDQGYIVPQVAAHDADRESTAAIRLLLDEYDRLMTKQITEVNQAKATEQNGAAGHGTTTSTQPTATIQDGKDNEEEDTNAHWRLGSQDGRLTSALRVQTKLSPSRPVFLGFVQRLRDYFGRFYSDLPLPSNFDSVKVCGHSYQTLVCY